MEVKQVIICRKDLGMRQGKCAAQAAHASLRVLLNMMYWEGGWPSKSLGMSLDCDDPEKSLVLETRTDSALYQWLNGSFTKICCYVNSEEELDELYLKALEAGIPTSMIVDSGKTEFHGVLTKTCIAIGPDYSEKIDKITGHLKLL